MMNLYDNWFYIHVLNTEWYIFFLVSLVVVFNFLSPLLFVLILKNEGKKNQEEQETQKIGSSGSI